SPHQGKLRARVHDSPRRHALLLALTAALTSQAGTGFIPGYADKSGHLYQLYEGAMTAAQELNQAGRYELSHLRSLEAAVIPIMRDFAAGPGPPVLRFA